MEKTDQSCRNEVLCRVCGDKASGKHYGVSSCDGCRGFFKRSIRRNLDYVCKESNACIVDVTRRNQCQACRFRKCLQVNMKRDAVQHERAPRSTSSSSKPKYLPCYPYYFPFKPTFYGSPFFNPSMMAAAAATSNRLPFEMSKFDLLSNPSSATNLPPSVLEVGQRRYHNPGLGVEDAVCLSNTQPPPPPSSLSSSIGRITNGGSLITSSIQLHPPTTTATSSPGSDSASGVKEDEVSSSGVDMQTTTQGFKLDLNLLTLNNESIYESAAKLLFLSVKWARSVPSFLHLPFGDQSQLLEEAWPELFILSAAQWSLPIDEGLLLTGSVVPNARQETLVTELRFLRDALARISAIRPDHTELACLKALVLFKPETQNLREPLQVEILQDQTHLMLQEYCVTKQPPNKIRFGKLLLILPSIRRISGKTLEELFFKQTVGDVPIERLLCDMFKAN
ncbi:unnamed protein product [Allacma fusca]|uniref:Uncharacterized protein n=1 Tax=Allacma fusca TaxID=39272 RepID=A0A8J2NSP1_9HEXA|nr:unnamed protein product [Allacma fusca]